MSEATVEKLIGTLLGTGPGATIMCLLFLICGFIFLYLKSEDLRKAISNLLGRLSKVGKDGAVFSAPPTVDASLPDQSEPEIQPKQIVDQSSEVPSSENDEDALFFKMFLDAYEGGNLETLNQTYTKLKNLPNRKMTDEDVQAHWFRLRMRLNESVEGELLALTESNPNWYFPYSLLARLYFDVEAIEQANKYWQEAFNRAHDDNKKREAHYFKAEIVAQSEGEKKALEYLQGVEPNAEWKDSKDYLFRKMADYQEKLGDKISQQLMLEKSLELNPTDSDLRFNLAFSYAEDRRTYLLAVYHYNLLLKQDPQNTSALNNLALLYEKLGDMAEHDKLLSLAIKYGSSHAKGNYIIDLLEKGFVSEAERLLESLTDEEKKEKRILDAVRHLERTKENQKEKTAKISLLPKLYKKYIDISIKNSGADSSKLAGVWQNGNKQLACKIDAANKVSGIYTITTPTGFGGLLFGLGSQAAPTIKEYSVSGDYKSGMLDILCMEDDKDSKGRSLSTLLTADMISFRLFLNEGQLKGFMWNKNDVPTEVIFQPVPSPMPS